MTLSGWAIASVASGTSGQAKAGKRSDENAPQDRSKQKTES
ncbi:hypothetical protein ACPWT1_20280 [Ramlibacter sp. MMS24-I3-19]